MSRYSEYIQSQAWAAIRRGKLFEANYKCEKCGRDDLRLDVHHLTYEHLGHEWMKDLIVLCRFCHKVEHKEIVFPEGWIDDGKPF